MERENYPLLFRLECENWWFAGRRNLLVKWLKQFGVSGVIADLGCASGSTLLAIKKFGIPVGVDMSTDALMFAREKTQWCVQARIEWLPFKDGVLDAMCCLDVIEHVEDDVSLLGEIRRVLKQGGRLVFSVPANQFLWSETDEMLHHVRRYSWQRFHWLVSEQLVVERMSYWNCALFVPAVVSVVVRNVLRRWQPGRHKKNVLEQIPSVVNSVLVLPLLVENWLLSKGVNLPFGVSMVGVARK